MVSETAAAVYCGSHLLGDVYINAAATMRSAALAMANLDVTAALGGSEPQDAQPFAVAAVCEQAIYLIVRRKELPNFGSDLKSESVDGVGSRTYRDEANRELAPRARYYLELFAPAGPLPVNRG